ncbi:MAG: YaaR family protein [Limnochordales bacterium]|nr:YaaR family protein [Limnochordales bacterium]
MKVSRRRTETQGSPVFAGRSGGWRGQVRAAAFQDELRMRQAEQEAAADRAIKDVDAAAARLRAELTLEALREYKEALRQAVAAALRRMYAVHTETGFARGGRRRLLYVVRTIDAKLEELTRLMLSQQRDNLALAARLDEIRGLLLDLYQ